MITWLSLIAFHNSPDGVGSGAEMQEGGAVPQGAKREINLGWQKEAQKDPPQTFTGLI